MLDFDNTILLFCAHCLSVDTFLKNVLLSSGGAEVVRGDIAVIVHFWLLEIPSRRLKVTRNPESVSQPPSARLVSHH